MLVAVISTIASDHALSQDGRLIWIKVERQHGIIVFSFASTATSRRVAPWMERPWPGDHGSDDLRFEPDPMKMGRM